ncbi:MAG TPA: enolase C-terminal domain-like protein [Gammaproteobacteria bacterium]|nr:enolase C-terminal domain-like protein [Gammaproteobacteria bacterium]
MAANPQNEGAFSRGAREAAPVESLKVSAYKIPTDAPESDGTLEWNSTTIVVAEVSAGGKTGLGYTYGHHAIATLIGDKLASIVTGRDVMNPSDTWLAMLKAIRNLGRSGITLMAISSVDIALWDLKARLLDLPLVTLLGAYHAGVPVYGSGGFTSYSDKQLRDQLRGWVDAGIPRVKMKIGREPDRDPARMKAARDAIGDDVKLFVDANGAYDRKQALAIADCFTEYGVNWYEEPVTSDDLEGLRLIRDRAPAITEIAAGEYGFGPTDFRGLLEAGAVDVLQADITRCGGVTGFLAAADLANAHKVPLSGHCAPALHLHPCCAIKPLRHLEYFHDHVRIERMLFDGTQEPDGGVMKPDLSRPGLGLELKRSDVEKYLI